MDTCPQCGYRDTSQGKRVNEQMNRYVNCYNPEHLIVKMSIEKTLLIGTVPYVREDIYRKNPGKYTLKPGEQLEVMEASSIIVEKKQTDTGTNDLQLIKNSGVKLDPAELKGVTIEAPKYARVSQQIIPASSTDKGISLPPEELAGHESLVAQLSNNTRKE